METQGDSKLLNALLDRRRTMLKALGVKCLRMTTRSSLTLHLSRSGALENAGIALHPVYGFVYLPGSGIKGLARAWAEPVWAPAQPDKERAWRRIEEAFGWSPRSEKHKFLHPKSGSPGWRPSEIKSQAGASVGRLVFHDAWPLRWPRLILDVINNHHGEYYTGEDDPGDQEEPNLVYFLAVDGDEQFEFAISDRKPGSDDFLETAYGWLRTALTSEGAGAKTAAGYGRFKPTEGETSTTLSPDFTDVGVASANFDLKLVTPAFLAGAEQQEGDCDLRPATLRGLLRWWWRTMHAAHLDRATLKRLETAVWGDVQSGSPVRIAVDFKEGERPKKYDYKDRQKTFQPDPTFKCQHDLENPPNKKTTQGLFYASYGMDDGPKREKRWFRPAGTQWSIRIDARRGRFFPENSDKPMLPKAEDILNQAVAALWLLCHFGGVGSKGRKGFGSFEGIEAKDITSIEDCQNLAQDFRKTCQLRDLADERQSARSPALGKIKPLEIQTPWRDFWTALDQLGYATQAFAQKYAHREEKLALGLPREIHGPRNRPIGHQQPATHQPPQKLSAKKVKRHAAPILYHLARSDAGPLLIRVTAFPSHYLPSLSESQRMLNELLGFLKEELKRRIQKRASIGQCEAPSRSVRSGAKPSEEKGNLSSASEKAKRVKARIQNLGGRGDVSKMPEIVEQIAQLPPSADRDECAQLLKEWLMRGGKKSLWKDKKHSETTWRKRLDSLPGQTVQEA